MKKPLIIGGIGLMGFGFWYYFNKQLQLAMNLSYKVKDLNVKSITKTNALVDCLIEIRNNSAFQVKVKSYSLFFSFDGNNFAQTQSDVPFIVKADSSFEVGASGNINFNAITDSIIPFLQDVYNKQPINIQIDGFITLDFLKTEHTVELQNKKITYSNNLLADLNIESRFDKLRNGIKVQLNKIGIKI